MVIFDMVIFVQDSPHKARIELFVPAISCVHPQNSDHTPYLCSTRRSWSILYLYEDQSPLLISDRFSTSIVM